MEDGAAGRSATVSAQRSRRFFAARRRLRPQLHHLPRLASWASQDSAVCSFRRVSPRLGLGGTTKRLEASESNADVCRRFYSVSAEERIPDWLIFDGLIPELTISLVCDEFILKTENVSNLCCCKLKIDCLKWRLLLLTLNLNPVWGVDGTCLCCSFYFCFNLVS